MRVVPVVRVRAKADAVLHNGVNFLFLVMLYDVCRKSLFIEWVFIGMKSLLVTRVNIVLVRAWTDARLSPTVIY